AAARLTVVLGRLAVAEISVRDRRLLRVLQTIGTPRARALERSMIYVDAGLTTLDTIHASFGAVDDPEWRVLSPRISGVLVVLNDPSIEPVMRSRRAAIATMPEMQALKDLLMPGRGATDVELKTALTRLRNAIQNKPLPEPE